MGVLWDKVFSLSSNACKNTVHLIMCSLAYCSFLTMLLAKIVLNANYICQLSVKYFVFKGGGGETLNYRSGVVGLGFLWMAFCHTLFGRVLCCYIGKMYEEEHLNFKNRNCACEANASPQPRVKKKNFRNFEERR